MAREKKSLHSLDRREFQVALVSVLIPFLIFFIFVYLPQLMNIFYSFTDWDGYSKKYNFIGLKNYFKFFTYTPMLSSIGNSFIFTICVTILGVITQLGMALLIHRGMKFVGFFKTIFYIPLLFSWVVLSIIWNSILRYNGLLNTFLHAIGLNGLMHDWIGETGTAMASVIFINTWVGFGYGLIIFLAGLSSIPQEINEAAEIDGAKGFIRFRLITLPLIMYSLTIDLFLGIRTLNTFDLIFIMTGGGPRGSTKTVALAIYEEAFRYERVGFACASAVLFTAIVGILAFLQVRTTRKLEIQY
ncbi:MAG TPA: sugar ABC transporter permease [Spirochaetia bacterium]|jgi:ABC-type sugar transport system permease subunit|nr:sugar ABC transporter permease [Spirochaetia bacterium]